jgi:protein-ribulosamine 3-kinase
MVSKLQEELLLEILSKKYGGADKILNARNLSGGDINQAAMFETSTGTWFAKWNRADAFPGMFEAEARGLELLRSAGEIFVPEVIGNDQQQDCSMLVLQFVQSGREKVNFWEDFGQQMANLHKQTSDRYGLDHNNYIGSLYQINGQKSSWIEFFIHNRLEIQIQLARDNSRIDSATIRLFEQMYTHLADFFPLEKPSLVHGDLWSGNFLVNSKGEACIIDPAVYYGHRLMDLGMSKLFGGFATTFYQAYHSEYPLEKNWIQAIDIANLYPLMVHVNLFGGGYLGSVKNILKRF